jgi:hypothetical protein
MSYHIIGSNPDSQWVTDEHQQLYYATSMGIKVSTYF